MPVHQYLSRAGILALSVVRDVMGMPVSSSDAWLVPVYVLIRELDWPATLVCTPCPSIRCSVAHDVVGPMLSDVRLSRTESDSLVKLSHTFLAYVHAGCPGHRVRAMPAAFGIRHFRRIGVSLCIHLCQTVLCSLCRRAVH
ncbi:hypothetical protein EDB89DRAFT_1971968 [Lactarius sanguifluus]|nr:hypothetical protein EDB89DRAFT_1971968 [Lactarius sanguifluus]